MHKKLFLLLILFILPAAAQTVAIRAGNLLDPAKGSVSKDQIILVENGKITAVGSGLAIPKDAQVVDLSKEWVMPGLIDAHTHITFQSAGCTTARSFSTPGSPPCAKSATKPITPATI